MLTSLEGEFKDLFNEACGTPGSLCSVKFYMFKMKVF